MAQAELRAPESSVVGTARGPAVSGALDPLREAARRYRAASREVSGESAAELCRAALAALGEGAERARLAAEPAYAEPRLVGFAQLLAAQAAADAGDWPAVLRHAKAAVAADQQDTYAQVLFGRAEAALAGGGPGEGDDLRERFCARPFQELEVRADGSVYTCCSAWLPVPIGDIRETPLDEIWNSAAAREIRRSVLDGDYRHCSRLYCPALAGRQLPRREEVRDPYLRDVVKRGLTSLDRRPQRVLMSQDRSCNLACPSCRDRVIVASKADVRRLNRLVEERVFPFLDGVGEIKVTGSGDPFGSAHFRWLLEATAARYGTGLKLQLQTNGVLLDARAWDELALEGRVAEVWVSTDAADPLTYAVVRRGGDWGRVLANLAFLGRLRREGRIGRLRLDFVVQARNFREMPAAVELAAALGCDGLYFQMVRNWETFEAEEFACHFVGAPDHPDFAEFLEVLRHPSLGRPGVNLSNIAELRRRALGGSTRPVRVPRRTAAEDREAGATPSTSAALSRHLVAGRTVLVVGEPSPAFPLIEGAERRPNGVDLPTAAYDLVLCGRLPDASGRPARPLLRAVRPEGVVAVVEPPGWRGADFATWLARDLPEAVVLRRGRADPGGGGNLFVLYLTRSAETAAELIYHLPGCALAARGADFPLA